jgi:hypothetical protein
MARFNLRDELSDKLAEYEQLFKRPFPAGMAMSGLLSKDDLLEIVQEAIDSGKPLKGPGSDVVTIVQD